MAEARNEPQCTAPAGGLLWRAAEDTNALDVSDRGGTLPHRRCMILVQAAGVTDGGAGLGGACDGTPQDSQGDLGRVLCCSGSCRMPGLEGGGRDAVPSTAALLRSILPLLSRRGVIAALGDDAGRGRFLVISSQPRELSLVATKRPGFAFYLLQEIGALLR